jgi:hypothetical protein
MTPRAPRRGYAMVAVVLFVMLFLGLWGVAGRQLGSMLRIEQARARRVQRDLDGLGATQALAKALAALEVGFPRTTPYTCRVNVGGTDFALTFTRNPDGSDPTAWSLQATPTTDLTAPTLDPGQFQPTPP